MWFPRRNGSGSLESIIGALKSRVWETSGRWWSSKQRESSLSESHRPDAGTQLREEDSEEGSGSQGPRKSTESEWKPTERVKKKKNFNKGGSWWRLDLELDSWPEGSSWNLQMCAHGDSDLW